MLATHTAESMSLARVIVNRRERIRVERRVNLCLRFWWTELIGTGDMQQQRVAQILCFVERLLNTHPVVSNRTIRFEPHRQQVREIPAQTKPHRARASTARRMLSQKLQ